MIIRGERRYEILPRQLTPEEIRQAGVDLAHETQALMNVEAQRKTEVARLRAEAQAVRDRIGDLMNAINAGVRDAEVEVMQLLDTPSAGTKRIIRLDTNATVREETMTDAERQETLGFFEETQ